MSDTPVELLARIDTNVAHLLETRADHESRLRRIERFMWVWVGAASIGGGAVAQIVHFGI